MISLEKNLTCLESLTKLNLACPYILILLYAWLIEIFILKLYKNIYLESPFIETLYSVLILKNTYGSIDL
jgi:hypothetical protein